MTWSIAPYWSYTIQNVFVGSPWNGIQIFYVTWEIAFCLSPKLPVCCILYLRKPEWLEIIAICPVTIHMWVLCTFHQLQIRIRGVPKSSYCKNTRLRHISLFLTITTAFSALVAPYISQMGRLMWQATVILKLKLKLAVQVMCLSKDYVQIWVLHTFLKIISTFQ